VAAGLRASRLRLWAAAARRRLPTRAGRLSIVLVGPTTSQRLNQRYRRKNKPTNVLSWLWPPIEQQVGEPVWGEIILCPAVIRREAPAFDRTYPEHLRRLLEHGMIHLLGADHETAKDQRRWKRLEARLT
jgi:probable rRNA maturation factor